MKMSIKMKVLIALICILAEVACIHGQDDLMNTMERCREEVGLAEIPDGSFHSQGPKVKCFYACILEKEGVMINGKLDYEKIISSQPENLRNIEEVHDLFKICVEIGNRETDKCEVAAAMSKCGEEQLEASPITLSNGKD